MINQTLSIILNFSRASKKIIQVLADCLFIVFSFTAAMSLRLDGFYFVGNYQTWAVLAFVIPVTILVFLRLGLYQTIIRYITSEPFFQKVLIGVLISSTTMYVSSRIFSLPIPRSVPFIFGFIMVFFVGGARFGVRALVFHQVTYDKKPVIIYGAGDPGRQLLIALNQGSDYVPRALVDDSFDLHNTEVGGLKVFPPTKLNQLISDHNVNTILLALPNASRSFRKTILQSLKNNRVQVKTVPRPEDIISGKANVSDLRPISIYDLLGREPVPPQKILMQKNILDRVVLVTGAGGSIGSELCKQILMQKPKMLILLENSEFSLYKIDETLSSIVNKNNLKCEVFPVLGSIQDFDQTYKILSSFAVETIYHAAAYKHVPLVERNPISGIINNVFGTSTLTQAAIQAGVLSFTLISTDKAVRPTNIMGATKRLAELICQNLTENKSKTVFSMVRFGNVLNSSGSVIPRFEKQIELGGPVTVTHPDITRYFMTIEEASQLVLQSSAMAKGGDVFILDMGEPMKIFDLAQSIIRLYGLTPYLMDGNNPESEIGDIGIVFTGLRDGEKLYEELLIDDSALSTEHPRIMKSIETHLNSKDLNQILDDLKEACQEFDMNQVEKILSNMQIGYKTEKLNKECVSKF